MSQKSIKSFFKPINANKRAIDSVGSDLSPKRKKIDEEETKSTGQMGKIQKQALLTPALHESIGLSWFNALEPEFNKDYFKRLSNFLVNERKAHTIYPPEPQVWTWTKVCSIQDVKVVIIGQDPYHGAKQAHGLAFSVQNGVRPPPSLLNIFKELKLDEDVDFANSRAGNSDLTKWGQQGVLLLNACLTVRADNANSHSDKGWEKLTDAVIAWINKKLSGVVFLLWGSYAQKKGSIIDKKKHLVMSTVHPSPLSAHRGFIGCKHFSKTNSYLQKNGKSIIDWSLE